MDKSHKKFLPGLVNIAPPREVYNHILFRVEMERVRMARTRLALFGGTSLLAGFALYPVFQYAAEGFSRSGSYEYLSLIFSDGTALLPYWKEFFFTLVESLPIFEIALVLTVSLVLLESIKLSIKNLPRAFYQYN
ncbi:MAG: hypothetical protein NT098_04295 [Candidatus Parcubacteria bacterium]|nr:hypothetical protein [Candidatus Parcubacteria bacterium]